MVLDELLKPESVVPNLQAKCKREALALLADHAASQLGVDKNKVCEALMAREQLGSTGVGSGVAIPHGKVEGIGDMYGLLAILPEPIDFDAVDDEPVDLIFVLLAPEEASAAHLKALAKVSRRLREDAVREALRGAETSEAILAILAEDARPNAA